LAGLIRDGLVSEPGAVVLLVSKTIFDWAGGFFGRGGSGGECSGGEEEEEEEVFHGRGLFL
jgi:hypothetical protein